MRLTRRAAAAATLTTIVSLLSATAFAQTYSDCNPLTTSNCSPDPALGRTAKFDFSSAHTDDFTAQSDTTYGSDGVSFTITESGDAPQLTSKWYIMFGRVDVSVKPAPGAGIVSSFVLQSDDLDEIDWEWLGSDPDEVQTNYFGQGETTSYNRGAFHSDPGSQDGFKTYTIDWTANQIVWQIDGVTVRVLKPGDSDYPYPQTPMRIKVGAWAGGDPSNAAGTIAWARGPTDYTQGPFTMQVKSMTVQDYSTGTAYSYGDQTGSWESIQAAGGSVNSAGSSTIDSTTEPAITASASGQPIPFRSEFPWVPRSTTSTPTVTYTTPYGLPSGWTVSSSGKVIPPSSAPVLHTPPWPIYLAALGVAAGFLLASRW